jgi:diguanylate cyclase (GGDEF)-like protein/PAS domain S-box-containing protein
VYRVLLIEESPTYRHILSLALNRPGILVEKCVDFKEGAERLLSQGEQFDGIVLGWPIFPDANVNKIQTLLCQSPLLEMALIVLAEDTKHSSLDWVARRIFGATILWEEYRLSGPKLDDIFLQISTNSTECKTRQRAREDVHVLLVDDSRTIRVVYKGILQKQGYKVDTASSADEAFNLAINKRFDIAIIDYFMEGGNGDVLCRRLSENSLTDQITTSILTSAYADEVIEESLKAGAVECMFKNEPEALFIARVDAMSHSVLSRRAIHREHQYLEGILGSVGEGVYGVNRNSHISFVNPAAQEILGYSKDEMIGRKPNKLFHYALEGGRSNPPEKCILTKSYPSGAKIDVLQTVFWAKDGTEIAVECAVHPLNVDGVRQGAVVAFRDISVRKLMEDELRWQANHDALTKLHNRRYFEHRLEEEVLRLQRSNEVCALLYVDLDRFKYINDTAGHAAGDKLLVEVSQQLKSRLRLSDTLARIGGDEFAVILRNTDADGVEAAANSFRCILEDYRFFFKGKSYRVYCSIGVAMLNKECTSTIDALSSANVALHIAKEKGRNNVHIYSGNSDARKKMDKDLSWSVRLKEALENNQFKLVFQPMVPVEGLENINELDSEELRWQKIWKSTNGRPLCCETLLRLTDTDQEDIRPGVFIGIAERFNLMPSIDRWVIAQGIKQLAQFNSEAELLQLTINLSGDTISDDSLGDYIQEHIQKHQVNPKNLIFEITETCAISNLLQAQTLIKQLRKIGCRFALDDFGSGFCSFGQLKNLDVDLIKIDGQFSLGLIKDPIDREIIVSIANIAKALGARTVAEFVETQEITDSLRDCGIDYVQGYHISKPVSGIPLLIEQQAAMGGTLNMIDTP